MPSLSLLPGSIKRNKFTKALRGRGTQFCSYSLHSQTKLAKENDLHQCE